MRISLISLLTVLAAATLPAVPPATAAAATPVAVAPVAHEAEEHGQEARAAHVGSTQAARGLLVVALLAIAAGSVGVWVVLRGLSFYAHAAGASTFPGLVLAAGAGFAPLLGAALAAAVVGILLALLLRRDPDNSDGETAVVLAGALAVGMVLATVLDERGAVGAGLFGSVLAVGDGELALAAIAAVVLVAAAPGVGRRWLAAGFDRDAARAAGLDPARHDALLLAAIALVVLASVSAVGSLLATALIVVPAATTRMLFATVRAWQIATVVLTALVGATGLGLAIALAAPPGATIAVLAGSVFMVVLAGRTRNGVRVAVR